MILAVYGLRSSTHLDPSCSLASRNIQDWKYAQVLTQSVPCGVMGFILLIGAVLITCQGSPEPPEAPPATAVAQATEAPATALPSPTDHTNTCAYSGPDRPTGSHRYSGPNRYSGPHGASAEPPANQHATSGPTRLPPLPTSTPTPEPTNTPTPEPLPSFDGVFVLTVARPQGKSFTGKTVEFRIGGLTAAETSSWAEGGVNPVGSHRGLVTSAGSHQ